jgi:hypothetical protein
VVTITGQSGAVVFDLLAKAATGAHIELLQNSGLVGYGSSIAGRHIIGKFLDDVALAAIQDAPRAAFRSFRMTMKSSSEGEEGGEG